MELVGEPARHTDRPPSLFLGGEVELPLLRPDDDLAVVDILALQVRNLAPAHAALAGNEHDEPLPLVPARGEQLPDVLVGISLDVGAVLATMRLFGLSPFASVTSIPFFARNVSSSLNRWCTVFWSRRSRMPSDETPGGNRRSLGRGRRTAGKPLGSFPTPACTRCTSSACFRPRSAGGMPARRRRTCLASSSPRPECPVPAARAPPRKARFPESSPVPQRRRCRGPLAP